MLESSGCLPAGFRAGAVGCFIKDTGASRKIEVRSFRFSRSTPGEPFSRGWAHAFWWRTETLDFAVLIPQLRNAHSNPASPVASPAHQLRGHLIRDIRNHLCRSPRPVRLQEVSPRGFAIPQVTIKTGLTTSDGSEELLTEYLCDHPGCPNIATRVLGCVKEVGAMAAVCDEHAPKSSS